MIDLDGLTAGIFAALIYSHIIAFLFGRLTAPDQADDEPTWDDIAAQGDCGVLTEHSGRISHKVAGNPTASSDDHRAAG
jgi:hypothetical protein